MEMEAEKVFMRMVIVKLIKEYLKIKNKKRV